MCAQIISRQHQVSLARWRHGILDSELKGFILPPIAGAPLITFCSCFARGKDLSSVCGNAHPLRSLSPPTPMLQPSLHTRESRPLIVPTDPFGCRSASFLSVTKSGPCGGSLSGILLPRRPYLIEDPDCSSYPLTGDDGLWAWPLYPLCSRSGNGAPLPGQMQPMSHELRRMFYSKACTRLKTNRRIGTRDGPWSTKPQLLPVGLFTENVC